MTVTGLIRANGNRIGGNACVRIFDGCHKYKPKG